MNMEHNFLLNKAEPYITGVKATYLKAVCIIAVARFFLSPLHTQVIIHIKIELCNYILNLALKELYNSDTIKAFSGI